MQSAAIVCAIVYFVLRYVDEANLSWQCLTRPIVVGPVVGLLLGDFHTGIVMGASLEAIFMGISAIGGAIPSDATSATIVAVAFVVKGGGDMETGLALAMPIGAVMSTLNGMLMALWSSLASWWENLAAQCNIKKFITINYVVCAIAMLPSTIVIFLGVAFGVDGLQAGLASLPSWVLGGLGAAGGMMTAIGFGILLSMIWSPKFAAFFFVGFIMAKSLGLSSLGIAVIGVCIAMAWFFLRKDVIDTKKELASAPATGAVSSEEDFF